MTASDLGVADPAGRSPRVERGGEAALGPPDRPEPRDRALVEERVADRARGVVLAQAPQEALAVELGCEHVRAERRELLVEARARRGHEIEDRAVELDDLAALGAEHQPRALRRAPPALAPAEHAPPAGHPQVRVDDEVALEADEQMLAVGVDRVDPAPGEAGGPAVLAEARMRRRDLVRDAAGEHRADPVRGVVDRVALGHGLVQRRRAAEVRSRAEGELARPGAEAELDEQRLPVGADDRLAVDALEREPPRAVARDERRRAPRAPSAGAGRRARRGT